MDNNMTPAEWMCTFMCPDPEIDEYEEEQENDRTGEITESNKDTNRE